MTYLKQTTLFISKMKHHLNKNLIKPQTLLSFYILSYNDVKKYKDKNSIKF